MFKNNPACSKEDMRSIYFAFERLEILKVLNRPKLMDIGKKVFAERHEEFLPKMQWINDFVRSKGFDEVVFRDTNDYDVSSADYDYYYELKTPEQLVEEEAARKKVFYSEMEAQEE